MCLATMPSLGDIFIYIIIAGLAIAVVPMLVTQARDQLRQYRVGRTGAFASAEIVEVTVVHEGRDGGRHRFGPITMVTRRNADGLPAAPILPSYRILLRFHADGHGEVVADLERRLSVPELDALIPGHRVGIRYDPATPEHVALDPASLRALTRGESLPG